jgi:signal transduction histidine kinase
MARATGVDHGRPDDTPGPEGTGASGAPAAPRSRSRRAGAVPAPPVPVVPPPAESAVHLLAAELHDGLSQQLFAAELDVHELRCTPGLTPEVREVLDRLALRLEMSSKELRGALFKMLEAEREHEELVAVSERVRDSVADFRDRHGCRAVLEIEGNGPEPDPAAARVLLRTVREGLANVAKHARAAQVLVVLRRGRRWWTVEVHDDGSGDPAEVSRCASAATSFGLFSLDTESARVGGRLWVTRAEGLRGVQLNVSVPVGAGPA